jgi:hypothetical protein
LLPFKKKVIFLSCYRSPSHRFVVAHPDVVSERIQTQLKEKTMKTLYDLKQYLKQTAFAIKANKPLLKHRDCSSMEKLKQYWDLMYQVQALRRSFRHHLIAYCELRGMARDRIEKPAQNNLPNEEAVDAVKKEYAATWSGTEDVCSSAA